MSITLRTQRTSSACTITNSRGSHLLTIKWSNQILVILNHIIPITDITLWYGRLVEGNMKEHKSGFESHNAPRLLPSSPNLTFVVRKYCDDENADKDRMSMRCGKHCEVLAFLRAIIRSGFWHYFGVHFWNRPLWNPPWYKAESKKRSMLDNRIRTATDWNVKEMIKW